jgi:hypothetical protein
VNDDQTTESTTDEPVRPELFGGSTPDDTAEPWSRWSSEPMPTLPKTAAVRRAFDACRADHLPENFARALASAVTDPAALRTALQSKRIMPVVGGAFEFIEVDLWTPAVTPMVTNHRAFEERVYPASGASGALGPLRGPTSDDGVTSTLRTDARDVAHALAEADRARTFILNDNKLADSIAERGIMMPVDVVYNEIHHGDGEPPACLLATAEGSSRITNAHEVEGLTDPRVVMYEYPASPDEMRRFINSVLLDFDSPNGAPATPRVVHRRRARRNALVVRRRWVGTWDCCTSTVPARGPLPGRTRRWRSRCCAPCVTTSGSVKRSTTTSPA